MEVVYTTSTVHFELRINAAVLVMALKITLLVGNLLVAHF